MPTSTVSRTRIHVLADADVGEGDYVLYWMQQAQRAEQNHALELAIQLANELEKPLVVGFGLYERYPEASARHFAFLLEGLAETSAALAARGIRLVVRRQPPDRLALELGRDACAIVCDRGYLRHQREWRAEVAAHAGKYVVEVESDVVVPVATAARHAEVAARTLRPKLQRLWDDFLVELRPTKVARSSLELSIDGIDVSAPHALLAALDVDHRVAPSAELHGGTSQAKAHLRKFLRDGLARYVENGKRPETDDTSMLSAYLHFGQISPITVALAVRKHHGHADEKTSFLDELLVRRELACNFVWFNERYDDFDAAVPSWAKETLRSHAGDERAHRYTRRQLEAAATHDPYWNAAMNEMKARGWLHNYMRMYWGKKILEWSSTPAQAFRTTLALNNRYFLDGRDPASYANVAWIFGLHDRPFFGRPIFGTVRYMSASGLERKSDTEAYLARAQERIATAQGE